MTKDDLFTAEWFPWYHERISGSDRVALMSLAEEGAYRIAIDYVWKHGSIASDPKICALRIGKKCTEKIAEKVLEMFVPMPENPSRSIHPTVEEIRSEQAAKYYNRVKGGKASAARRSKQRTSSNTEQCSSNTEQDSNSYKRVEIESRDREEEKAVGEPQPLLEIHTGKIMAGICSELGVKKLSMSVQREFENEALTAFQNGFSAESFVECFSLLRKVRSYTIKANYVTDQLPDLDKLRLKAAPAPVNGSPNRPTARQLIAEARAQEEALAFA